jgi:hypothetical protein
LIQDKRALSRISLSIVNARENHGKTASRQTVACPRTSFRLWIAISDGPHPNCILARICSENDCAGGLGLGGNIVDHCMGGFDD